MEQKVDKTDFELMLVLKNNLLVKDKDQVIKLFDDSNNYMSYICAITHIINYESAFFSISQSYAETLESALLIHRFDISEEMLKKFPNISSVINQITLALNNISSADLEERRQILSEYINWQRYVRDFRNGSVTEILESIADDVIIYFYLTGDIKTLDNDTYPMADRIKLSSLTYLLKVFPDLFRNEDIMENASKIIDLVYRNTSFFDIKNKVVSIKTKQKLKSVFKEE